MELHSYVLVRSKLTRLLECTFHCIPIAWAEQQLKAEQWLCSRAVWTAREGVTLLAPGNVSPVDLGKNGAILALI